MPEPSLLVRLKQRKVAPWLLGYIAGAWLLLQALDIAIQNFDLPHLVFRAAVALLAAGFLAALVLAWYHGEKGAQRVTGLEVLLLAVLALAGVAGSVLVVVRGRAPSAATPAPVTRAAASVDNASIAVLPFEDVSPKHDQEYFADGLTEELQNALAQVPALRVAARTSSFAFKGKGLEADSIGRALRVAHLLEGSVRTDGARVRIGTQLVDTRTGYQLWSQRYDRELRDVFAVQGEIAQAIVDTLRLALGGASETRPAPAPAASQTSDPRAHTLMLRGVYLARLNKREDVAEAVRVLRQAVERDPGYARAHAELGGAYQRAAYVRAIDPDEGYRLAEAEARQALALDSTDFRAHELLGRIADFRHRDYRAAEAHFARALQGNPSDAPTHSHRAWMLMRLNRVDEALAEGRKAVELDPVSGGMISNLAAVQYYAGRFGEAVASWQSARALDPSDPGTIGNLAMGYAMAGRAAEAIRAAEDALRLSPDDAYAVATTAYVYARAGRRADAERLLRTLEARRQKSPYLLAGVHMALGDRERALQLLGEALQAHDDFAGDIAVDPVFAPLHGEARFQRLLSEAGVT